MRKHYERMIKDTDLRVKKSLRIQITDTDSPFYGGFTDSNKLVEAKFAIYRVMSMISAYKNEESKWYQNEEVADHIMLGLSYVARVQHENGLFDYIDCNFFSAPDTAFIIKKMMPTLRYLDSHRKGDPEEKIYQKLFSICRKAAFGLLQGGFHTPNHRWAIASNLVDCAEFFKAPELKEAAFQYLKEGIDCNDDGEFAEKSAGNYNRINNDAMIMLAKQFQDKTYCDYAIRNLTMMLSYIEPDGTIFTANSTRQDNGKRIYPKDYYWEYLIMGKYFDIPEFTGFSNYIFELIDENHLSSPDILIKYMSYPELIDWESTMLYIPKRGNRVYEESGIMRAQKKDFTYTLMRGKSNFLYFSNTSMDIGLKIGGSLCEHRAFVPETLTQIEGGYELAQTMHGWYYLPLPEKPETSDWWKMDNAKRPKVSGPDMHILVRVTEVEDGIDVFMKLSGIQNAPFRVELALIGAKDLENEHFAVPAVAGMGMIAKEGMVLVSNDKDAIEVGPAFGAHAYTTGKFGSEAAEHNCFTLYFTDYTEFEHCIHIRNA